MHVKLQTFMMSHMRTCSPPPRKMVSKAWEWAKNHGPTKHRVNAIHGEEEIRIILSDTFEHEELGIEENTRTGTMEVEEPLGTIF